MLRAMLHDVRTLLDAWDNFYVIVGSSSAALIGLQFVTMALVSDTGQKASVEVFEAFQTPTVVHFGEAFAVAAVMASPWPALWHAAAALGVCAAFGIVYALLVLRRTRRQTLYQMVGEDWVFHIVLPLVAYLTLAAGAATLLRYERFSLFVVAAAELALLFDGIHNAWDNTVYITLNKLQSRGK